MTFIIPTLLQVSGIDDNEKVCVWYAEAVGRIMKNDEYYYEGYYLVPSKTNTNLVYDETYDLIPEKSVMAKLAVKDNLEDAWGKMGLVMNETNNGVYFKKIGEPLFDSYESDEEDIGSVDSYSTESDDRSNISDLIDDSEVPTSFLTEARGLNEEFNAWVPKDEKERRVKAFIESLEHKAAHEMDERTF